MCVGFYEVFVSQYFSPTTTENHNYGVLGSEAENVKCLVRGKLLCTASVSIHLYCIYLILQPGPFNGDDCFWCHESDLGIV